jgi:hypothetical protein
MNQRTCRLLVPLAALVAVVACTKSNSGGPSASIGAPRPVTPANGAAIKNADQPVTLVVQNAAISTPVAGTAYTFEVASDAAFSTKIQTKTGVAEGSGQTTVKLDTLPAARDYYWHVLATNGSTTGTFGTSYMFTIGPAVTISTPVPISPLTGQATDLRPALRVTNVTRTGPAGAITYRFEIASNSAFSPVIATATVAEGINETGFIPTTDLAVNTTFFWRATAIDAASGVTSTSSAVQSFTTNRPSQAAVVAAQLGVPLWPGIQPPGSLGHATMGNDAALGVGWAIQTLHYAPGNVNFQSPDIEMLRLFDLFDRGFHPDDAVAWMNSNGYPTNALWYPPPEKAVMGLKYVYIAARGKVFVNGIWDIVLRVE